MPSDLVFQPDFQVQSGGSAARVRYVLRKLERALNAQDSTAGLTIEHIAPQTATEFWKKAVPVDYEEMVQRWGNLTWLAQELNSAAQNEPWPKKREIYAKPENSRYQVGSQIAITAPLLDVSDWNEDEIARRQRWMSDLAVQIWREDGAALSGNVKPSAH